MLDILIEIKIKYLKYTKLFSSLILGNWYGSIFIFYHANLKVSISKPRRGTLGLTPLLCINNS